MEMQAGSRGDELVDSVRRWMAAWGGEVAAARTEAARARFDPAVVGFGTATAMVFGIDELHDDQWSTVWPTIRGFTFDVDSLVVLASPDGRQAVAVVPWRSEGQADDGTWFDRPGRATVVLRRASAGAPWLGIHTHFSLVPVRRT